MKKIGKKLSFSNNTLEAYSAEVYTSKCSCPDCYRYFEVDIGQGSSVYNH